MKKTNVGVVPLEDLVAGNKMIDFLDIELTERCNNVCVHCYIRRFANDRAAAEKEMTTPFVYSLLDEAKFLGCTGVRFTGGEPMLRKDFTQIYLYAHNLGLRVSISTNATLITDEIANMLAENLPEGISISAYGWDDESYDSVAGIKGSFRRFLNGVGKLNVRNIPFMIKYPPVDFLVKNSDKIVELAEWLGSNGDVPHPWELTLHARHDVEECERIRKYRMTPHDAAKQRLREPGFSEHYFERICSGKKMSKRLFPCRAARDRLSIDSYGKLQVCLEIRHPNTVYDLIKGSLLDAFVNHLPKFRKMKISDETYLNRCGNCSLRSVCSMCPACSWMEHGNLEQPVEYVCDIMHEEARMFGLLKEDEKGWEVNKEILMERIENDCGRFLVG